MLRIYSLQALVQPVGPSAGRGAVRLGSHAAVCGHRFWAASWYRTRPRCGSSGTYWKSPLGGNILEAENLYLDGKGLRITRIVDDATIIHAPSSTKNWEQKREMHQTGEGKQWYFGMRAHGGVKPVIVASVCRFIALRAFT